MKWLTQMKIWDSICNIWGRRSLIARTSAVPWLTVPISQPRLTPLNLLFQLLRETKSIHGCPQNPVSMTAVPQLRSVTMGLNGGTLGARAQSSCWLTSLWLHSHLFLPSIFSPISSEDKNKRLQSLSLRSRILETEKTTSYSFLILSCFYYFIIKNQNSKPSY